MRFWGAVKNSILQGARWGPESRVKDAEDAKINSQRTQKNSRREIQAFLFLEFLLRLLRNFCVFCVLAPAFQRRRATGQPRAAQARARCWTGRRSAVARPASPAASGTCGASRRAREKE